MIVFFLLIKIHIFAAIFDVFSSSDLLRVNFMCILEENPEILKDEMFIYQYEKIMNIPDCDIEKVESIEFLGFIDRMYRIRDKIHSENKFFVYDSVYNKNLFKYADYYKKNYDYAKLSSLGLYNKPPSRPRALEFYHDDQHDDTVNDDPPIDLIPNRLRPNKEKQKQIKDPKFFRHGHIKKEFNIQKTPLSSINESHMKE